MDLVCSSDTHWEFCIWTQKESRDASNTCHLEWKRAKDGVILDSCNNDKLKQRISVIGSYEDNECGIRIVNVTQEDAGAWKCEVTRQPYFP